MPFVIAEMSANHNRSLARALEIVDAAAEAGADAVKLQTFHPRHMTLDVNAPNFVIHKADSPWRGKRLYQLYEEAALPWDWHGPIFARCRQRGIAGFSTPFHPEAVDFLEAFDTPYYKIASFENNYTQLLRRVAQTDKRVIVSTGASTMAQIAACVEILGRERVTLLKCTSAYPATPADAHLRAIPLLRDTFGCEVGLSDHTTGIGVAVAAVALGATVIEKHFTISRADGGLDAEFSLEPHELKLLVEECRRAEEAVQGAQVGDDGWCAQYKRSIYVAEDVAEGEPFTTENLRVVRPAGGLPPECLELLLGRAAPRSLNAGTPLTPELLHSTDAAKTRCA